MCDSPKHNFGCVLHSIYLTERVLNIIDTHKHICTNVSDFKKVTGSFLRRWNRQLLVLILSQKNSVHILMHYFL